MKSKLWMVCCEDSVNSVCDKYLIAENPEYNPEINKRDFVIRTIGGYLSTTSKSYLCRIKDGESENGFNNIDDTCKKCKYGLRFIFNKCTHKHLFTEFKENSNER